MRNKVTEGIRPIVNGWPKCFFPRSRRGGAGFAASSKLRSFLTLLGIILATTTLIAVMSVIHGMDVYIANSVSSMGADGFRVVRIAFIGNLDPKKFLELQRKNPQLTPGRVRVSEEPRHSGERTRHGGQAAASTGVSWDHRDVDSVALTGGTPNWGVLANTEIDTGRYFTEIENNHHARWRCWARISRNACSATRSDRKDRSRSTGARFTVIGVGEGQGQRVRPVPGQFRRHSRPDLFQDLRFAQAV